MIGATLTTRLKQGGMNIVTNKYPHNWAYQPSMVEGSPWTDIRVRKAANLAVDPATTGNREVAVQNLFYLNNVVHDVLRVIRRLKDERVAVLLVEQNPLAALGVSDRVYVMDKGRIVYHGEAAALRRDGALRQRLVGV